MARTVEQQYQVIVNARSRSGVLISMRGFLGDAHNAKFIALVNARQQAFREPRDDSEKIAVVRQAALDFLAAYSMQDREDAIQRTIDHTISLVGSMLEPGFPLPIQNDGSFVMTTDSGPVTITPIIPFAGDLESGDMQPLEVVWESAEATFQDFGPELSAEVGDVESEPPTEAPF